jgi:hypothetical protein
MGIAILLLSAAFISVVVHRSNRSFLGACAFSGFLASLVVVLIDSIRRGYPGNFFLLAILFGTLWGGLASAAVGGTLRLLGYYRPLATERKGRGDGRTAGRE